MAWLQGDVFRCANPDCECELTLTRESKNKRGSFLPECCCCGRLMEILEQAHPRT